MTIPSELFYNRRSRFGRNTHVSDLGLGSSHQRNLHHTSTRRHHNHHRHDSDGCDPLRRSPLLRHASNRLPLPDREPVRVSDAISHSDSGNSTNIEASINGPRLTENGRLPGAVLLARERLLQRLRGLPISENRPSIPHRSRTMISNNVQGADAEDREYATELSTRSTSLAEVTSQMEHLQLSQHSKKKPPGLTQDALDSLHLEVFRSTEHCTEKVAPRSSWDCIICLEDFMDGDKLICLPCGHRFHSTCLDPWVQACGNCPYCRRGIVLTSMKA